MVSESARRSQHNVRMLDKEGVQNFFARSKSSTCGKSEDSVSGIVSRGSGVQEDVAVGFKEEEFYLPVYCGDITTARSKAEEGLAAGKTPCGAVDDEVLALRVENERLKKLLEELMQANLVLGKRLTGLGWSCEVS